MCTLKNGMRITFKETENLIVYCLHSEFEMIYNTSSCVKNVWCAVRLLLATSVVFTDQELIFKY